MFGCPGSLRVLHLEPDPVDARRVLAHLHDSCANLGCTQVRTVAAAQAALTEGPPFDVVVSAYDSDDFVEATLACMSEFAPETPLIIVSSRVQERQAVQLLERGVTDYVWKDRLTRLRPAIVRTVGERRAREERRAADERFRRVLESQLDGLVIFAVVRDAEELVPVDLRYEFINPAAHELLDTTAAGATGKLMSEVRPEALDGALDRLRPVIEQGQPLTIDNLPVCRSAGLRTARYVDFRAVPHRDGCAVFFRDVTTRHEAEKHAARMAQLYATLSKVNEAIVHARDRLTLFQAVCEAVVDASGAAMAWIGEVDPERPDRVRVAGGAGPCRAYLEGLRVAIRGHYGRGPVGRAIREGRTVVSPSLESDPGMVPWRRQVDEQGFHSAAAFPLFEGGQIVGALALYSCVPSFFHSAEVELLEQLAEDVSYAVLALEQDRQRNAIENRLKRAVDLIEEGEQVAGFGSWEWDVASDHLNFSVGSIRLLGLDPNGHAGWREVTAALGFDVREMLREEGARETLARGQRLEREYVFELRGEQRVFALLAKPTLDEDGRLVQVIGTIQDITKRVAAARELSQARKFLAAVTDSMGEGLLTLGPEGDISYVNQAALRLLGWQPDELLEKRAADLILTARSHLATAALPGMIRSDEETFVRCDGSLLPISYVCSPLRDGGPDGTRVIVFTDDTKRRAERQALERELAALGWVGRIRTALEEDRLVLHAQPIVNLESGEVVQHELLVRMLDADGTLIAPGMFLPVAEEYGLIKDIDRWVIERGIEWAAAGHRVELNLSAASLGDRAMGAWIETRIRESGVDPARVTFEVTETALLSDNASGAWFASRLAALGCGLALDDFGTGYGGFTYLKRLHVDIVKIDIEFVRDLVHDEASRHVVAAVVNLAEGFGLRTIAEGIEDEATLSLLRELKVECGQGYLFGRPAPVEQAFELLAGRAS